MKRECFKRRHQFLAGAILCVLASAGGPTGVSAQLMSNYTNYPVFLNQTVPPNILFLVDMGNYTLEAAYSGTNHRYWISFKSGTVTDGKLAANVTIDSAVRGRSGRRRTTAEWRSIPLVSRLRQTRSIPPSPITACSIPCAAIQLTPTASTTQSDRKQRVSDACGNAYWDGNFMNWLTARKKETIYQVLVGGEPIPAQANQDGTANNLNADPKTGENGSTNTCASNSKSCWRFVKFVPSTTLWPTGSTARIPTTLRVSTVNLNGGGTGDDRGFSRRRRRHDLRE